MIIKEIWPNFASKNWLLCSSKVSLVSGLKFLHGKIRMHAFSFLSLVGWLMSVQKRKTKLDYFVKLP